MSTTLILQLLTLKMRPWLMEMDEKPVPTDARQRTPGPSAGHAALTFSEEIPLRFGPRHWGQSAAGKCEVRKAAATIQNSFIRLFYYEPSAITRRIPATFCSIRLGLRLNSVREPHQ